MKTTYKLFYRRSYPEGPGSDKIREFATHVDVCAWLNRPEQHNVEWRLAMVQETVIDWGE